jgi:hypothetical protein
VLLVLIQTGFISRAAVTERNVSEVVLAERCHVLPVLVLICRVLSWLLCGNGIGLMWITIIIMTIIIIIIIIIITTNR